MSKAAEKVLPCFQADVDAATGPKDERAEFSIAGQRGLKLAFTATGTATYLFAYTLGTGRLRRKSKIAIARRDEIKLKAAVAKAEELRRKVAEGIDPAREEQAREESLSFKELAEKRLAEDASLAETTRTAYRQTLTVNVFPVIGHKLACDVRPEEVAGILNRIEDRGAARHADHTKAAISSVYTWAKRRWPALYPDNPTAGLGIRATSVPRTHTLTEADVVAFWRTLEDVEAPLSPTMRLFFKLSLLLGKRRGELAGAEVKELALASTPPTWTIPGDTNVKGKVIKGRSKNGAPQTIYLSKQAVTLIREALALAGKGAVFLFPASTAKLADPATLKTPHLHPDAVSKAMLRLRAYVAAKADAGKSGTKQPPAPFTDATTHDLRRTMATWFGEQMMHPTVIEVALGHAGEGVTRRHYNHANVAEHVARAWQAWADHIEALTGALPRKSNVVAFNVARTG
jgi:integrase